MEVEKSEGKFSKVARKVKDNGINLVFKDSFLLLPMSLRKLCKSFSIPK